jgi:ketosteroid isomerase-like protein
MRDTKRILEQAYAAFNTRDIDGALALMTHDVRWPKALAMTDEVEDTIRVRVRQLVKSLQGNVLSDSEVLHVFTLNDGLISAMTLADEADRSAGPSAAFGHRP